MLCAVVLSARLFPSSRGALSLVGFFATIILYLVCMNIGIAIVCMTIDEEDAGEAVNGTLNGTNYYARYDDRMNNKWSPGMWAYDTHAWTQRSHDVMNDDEDACPGEAESDEEFEEVT